MFATRRQTASFGCQPQSQLCPRDPAQAAEFARTDRANLGPDANPNCPCATSRQALGQLHRGLSTQPSDETMTKRRCLALVTLYPTDPAEGWRGREHRMAWEPDRKFRHRRAQTRRRPDPGRRKIIGDT